jgi:hypothetical protein
MNPELLAQLEALLGRSRTASTPLPPVITTAWQDGAQPTIGPRDRATPNVGDERMSGGRLATEIGVGFSPVAPAPDFARAIQSGAEGDWKGVRTNLAWAAAALPGMKAGRAALKGGRDALRRIFGTHEAIPGAGTGHLQGLLKGEHATAANRADYAKLVDWRTPERTDLLYDAAGLRPDRTRHGTGLYTPPEGATEFNPMQVARKELSPYVPKTHIKRILNSVEGPRALLDAQNAGAWHSVREGAGDAVHIPMFNRANPALLNRLDQMGKQWNGGAVDTGRGITILPPLWDAKEMNMPSKAILARVEAALRGADDLGAGGLPRAPYIADTTPRNYFSLFEGDPVGGGAATRRAFEHADPDILARLDSDPRVAARIRSLADRDRGYVQRGFGETNPGIDYAREVAAGPTGLRGLWHQAMQGESQLPALALLTGGGAMAANAEDGDGALAGAALASMGLFGSKSLASQFKDADAIKRIFGKNPRMTGQALPPLQGDYDAMQNPRFRDWFEQSRVRHPEGPPQRVFHGTRHDFDRFQMPKDGSGQLGIHVATDPVQANHFANWTFDGSGNVMPLHMRAQNPLRLPDMGNWESVSDLDHHTGLRTGVGEALRDLGIIDAKGLERLQRQRNGGQSIAPSLRRILHGEGFDSVVYRNRYEGVPEHVRRNIQAHINDENLLGKKFMREDEFVRIHPDASDALIGLSPGQFKSATGNSGRYSRRDHHLLRALPALLGGGAVGGMALPPEDPDA